MDMLRLRERELWKTEHSERSCLGNKWEIVNQYEQFKTNELSESIAPSRQNDLVNLQG